MAGREMTTREMIDALIGFDTTSAKSNMALIEWVADYLDGHGIASHLIHSDDKQRARLNMISHLLSQVSYRKAKRPEVTLPDRKIADAAPVAEHVVLVPERY